MYHHHRLWSCMSNSNLRKGLISTRRWLSSSTSSLSSSSSSSSSSGGGGGGKGIMISTTKKRGFPRIPLLFLSPTSDGRILPVFDPSGRCFYDIPIPKVVQGPDNSVRGSGHGWLVMAKSNDEFDDHGAPTEMILSLYNPITRAHIPLPPLGPNVTGYFQVWCNPSNASPGQPLVSFTYGPANMNLIIHEKGGGNELIWSTEVVTPPGDGIMSSVYHEAEAVLYVLYRDGRLSVLDILPSSSSTLRPLIGKPSPDSSWWDAQTLVVGAAGDVLMVVEEWPDVHQRRLVPDWTCLIQYHVFKLDRICLKWVRTTSIGDHTLFVYHNYHRIVSMPACDHHPAAAGDISPNQIYIFKQGRTYPATNRQVQETDTNIMIEVSGDVQVCDLISAEGAPKSTRKGKRAPLFKTSKILRGAPLTEAGYMQFAAWMVPSLS